MTMGRLAGEIAGVFISIIVLIGLLMGLVALIGRALETVGQHREAYERCLKAAVSAYEAERCR